MEKADRDAIVVDVQRLTEIELSRLLSLETVDFI